MAAVRMQLFRTVPAVRPVAGIKAEYLGPAAVAGAETLQDLQGGGLAGAIRPEQREDLPAGTVKLTPRTACTAP
jgi:hypothetical protein